jgi:hypothetical protein
MRLAPLLDRRRLASPALAAALLVSVVACGKSNPAPATPTGTAKTESAEKSDGTLRPITQGQLKVAHYATGDGVLGLVLDRTGEHAKVRIDGEKDITELTMEEDRYAGQRRGWYLKTPDGRNMMYLGASGHLKIYRGRDELSLNSDKAAEALPAATIAGQYKQPKSAYDIEVETLTPLSVAKRMPSFKPEESGNLAKVAEAFAQTTPDMLVHVTQAGAKNARWTPASAHIGNVHQGLGGTVVHGPSDEKWDKSKGGIAKFGGVLVPMRAEYNSPNRLRLYGLQGFSGELAVGTPGIIWEVDGGTVVLVTLDGGRYQISVENDGTKILEPGAGPQASWPAPLQHALFDVDNIRALAKGNAVAAQVGKDIEAADDGWFECINEQWKKAKTELDKVEASSASANDKWGRMGGVRKSAELAAPKTCEPKKKALDAALTKFIEARNVERLAVFEKAKTKLK